MIGRSQALLNGQFRRRGITASGILPQGSFVTDPADDSRAMSLIPDLVCIVCFGTNDREIARFTTPRLNPKIDRELGKTLVDSVIYYWGNGGQTRNIYQNVVLVEWLRRQANWVYRSRLPSTQNRKSTWVPKKARP
jgi:hypothetical protein